MNEQSNTKTAASVTEVARMVGLSRARFYQLQRSGIFPSPVYDIATKRPFYTEEQQRTCLEVRRRNCGVNGQPLIFYAQRSIGASAASKRTKRRRSPRQSGGDNARLIDGLKALGLADPNPSQVEAAVRELFPAGTSDVDKSEVIRSVFLRLQRRNSADNVGG